MPKREANFIERECISIAVHNECLMPLMVSWRSAELLPSKNGDIQKQALLPFCFSFSCYCFYLVFFWGGGGGGPRHSDLPQPKQKEMVR